MRGRLQLAERDQLRPQMVHLQHAVLDDHVGIALDEALQPLMAVQIPHDEIVHEEQRRRADAGRR